MTNAPPRPDPRHCSSEFDGMRLSRWTAVVDSSGWELAQ
jgi:hypothetical protein